MPNFAVLFPAGGSSNRFNAGRGANVANKLLAPLAGQPVLHHSLQAFAKRRDVRAMVIAATAQLQPMIPPVANLRVCEGGPTRAASVLRALLEVPNDVEWIAVHDAARPLVSQELIDRTLAAALEHGAAVPAVPVAQTIRRAGGPLPAASQGVVARDGLFAMQTPQIMRRAELLKAYGMCKTPLEQITDDAQLLELAGQVVWLVAGDERNIKITLPDDLAAAEAMMRGGK